MLAVGCGGPGPEPGTSEPEAVCGDRIVQASEMCDDGNVDTDDGCDASCVVELGYSCLGQPSGCTTICGDGLVLGAEVCDDGGLVVGDGCDNACLTEEGYVCEGEPSVCNAVCGDGLLVGLEACDDGNTALEDGCDDACAIEEGYACEGEPSTCGPICGDGLVVGLEGCDDGNTEVGDGCDEACVPEEGYACDGEPSVCGAVCGDGLIIGLELCDDGNTEVGDGCDAGCLVEESFECEGEPSVCIENCDSGFFNLDSATGCFFQCISGDLVRDPEDCTFEPRFLRISGQFGTDGTSVADVIYDGETLPAFHESLYGNDAWDGSATDVENYCIVVLPFTEDSPYRAEVDDDEDLWFGFDWDGSVVGGEAFTNCYEEGYGLDEADWGTEEEFVASHAEGNPMFLVLAEFTQDVGDAIEAAEQSNGVDLPFVGARISTGFDLPVEGVQTGELPAYAEGLEIDENHEIVVDTSGGFTSIADTDVWDGEDLTPGFYYVTSFYGWTFSR